MDLAGIAARLEAEEKLMLKYRVQVAQGDHVDWVVRTDRLLDVAEDRGILYVELDGSPVWIDKAEAIEVYTVEP